MVHHRPESNVPMEMPKHVRRYALLPMVVATDKELSDAAKIVYALLDWFSGTKGFCWPEQKELALILGKSRERVNELLRELHRHGHVQVKHHHELTKTEWACVQRARFRFRRWPLSKKCFYWVRARSTTFILPAKWRDLATRPK